MILSFSLWQIIVNFASLIMANDVQKANQATKDQLIKK